MLSQVVVFKERRRSDGDGRESEARSDGDNYPSRAEGHRDGPGGAGLGSQRGGQTTDEDGERRGRGQQDPSWGR